MDLPKNVLLWTPSSALASRRYQTLPSHQSIAFEDSRRSSVHLSNVIRIEGYLCTFVRLDGESKARSRASLSLPREGLHVTQGGFVRCSSRKYTDPADTDPGSVEVGTSEGGYDGFHAVVAIGGPSEPPRYDVEFVAKRIVGDYQTLWSVGRLAEYLLDGRAGYVHEGFCDRLRLRRGRGVRWIERCTDATCRA